MSSKVQRVLFLVLILAPAGPVAAGVVVVANRTSATVELGIVSGEAEPERVSIPVDEFVVLPTQGTLRIVSPPGSDAPTHYELAGNAVYFFADAGDGIELRRLDLGQGEVASGAIPATAASSEPVEISVKILVDDDEPGAQRVWEARLRNRIQAASQVLDRCCRVRLKVVAAGTWNSDNGLTEVGQSLREFEQEVDPAPGQLAIGFSGQRRQAGPDQHLGGTRGLLRTHILVREWSSAETEAERLEVLLHELGHYLGAAHSPEATSVMRAKLGDGQARLRDFRVGFDAVSALVMNLVAEELRTRRITQSSQLSAYTRQRLARVYATLGETVPEDSSATQLETLVNLPANPLVYGTRRVIGAIVDSARQVHPADGDALTARYVQAAAAAARDLPIEVGPLAFAMGVGIALDDSDLLQTNVATRQFCAEVESEDARRARLAVLGNPTVLGRRDLAQHFFVSVFLAASLGTTAAESAGLAKEVLDARSGSGFSYADLAADYAGIRFARSTIDRQLMVLELIDTYEVRRFMPPIDGLPEGLSWDEWTQQFGLSESAPYQRRRAEILQRIQQLEPYKEMDR